MPVITDDLVISLHTAGGAQLYQFNPSRQSSFSFGRDGRDVSRAEINLPPTNDIDQIPVIIPWLHWVSIWDGGRNLLLWKGPVQKSVASRNGLQLSVRDPAAFLARTRNPMTKRWEAADPAWIAGELWPYVAQRQGFDEVAIVRADPEGDRFDFAVVTDAQMLDQTFSDLVNLGLKWAIVSGVPVIGPVRTEPIATLKESDFLGDINMVRDGAQTFNDVLVRGPDNLARARTELGGAQLETIITRDSMFGISNVTKAARQYLRSVSTIRTDLDLPAGTSLHPDAPVDFDDLIPSARFIIEAYGIRQLMELESVEVDRGPGLKDVKVTMTQVLDVPELSKQSAQQRTLGGQTAAP